MFWFIYISTSLFLSHLVSIQWKKYYFFLFSILFIFLVTPTQVDLSETHIAPAIFVFLYDVIFEQNYSFRALRPLALSMPLILISVFVALNVKKRFSG